MSAGTLSVCASCEGRQAGAPLLQALTACAAGSGVLVTHGPCLGPCGAGVRVALTGNGRWSWLFQGLDPDRDMADFARFLAAWTASPTGEVAKSARLSLVPRTIGRTPPAAP